jgi:hypothetical protein
MRKFKTFLVMTMLVVFSFSLIGCGFLTSRSTETVEEVTEGELPEWLLLAYRAEESSVDENADPPGEVKEPPAETTQPAAATTQPASGSTAPATSAPASTTSSLEKDIDERMNDILREIYAEEIKAAQKIEDEKAKAAAKEKDADERGFANWWRD